MRNMSEEKIELKKRFQSAKSSEEKLKLIKKMESCFQQHELGFPYFTLAKQLLTDGFFEKVLFYGKKALRIFISNNIPFRTDHTCDEHKSSVRIAFVLDLLSDACVELKQFDESFGYMNWSYKSLSKVRLDLSSSCGGKCVLSNLFGIQRFLLNVKKRIGRKEECVGHLIKMLEVKEAMMEDGCIELGECYKGVYEWYVWGRRYEDALPFCLKALEIYEKCLGRESGEVGNIMWGLASIYNRLGEYERALGQVKLARSILRKTSLCSDLLLVEIEMGNALIGLGRYEEAVGVLKGVVSRAPKVGSELPALAFVSLARASCDLQKFEEAREYLRRVLKFLGQIAVGPTLAATLNVDMARLYERMNGFEIAINLWKMVLTIPELPHKLHAEAVRRIFSLVSLTDKEKELIPYLEHIVDRLKEVLGPNHCQVGYSYLRLGYAYMKVGEEELAVKFMEDAKDIMNASLDPHHRDSLITSQVLSVTYGIMERYKAAIDIQEDVIDGLKGLGPREQEFMDEAVRQLNRMKEKLAESPTRASYQSKNGEDLSAKISKCGYEE